MKEVELYGGRPDPEHDDSEASSTADMISAFIRELLSVESLRMSVPAMVSLRHLTSLPSLRILGIQGLPAALETSVLEDEPRFVLLRHLSIRGSSGIPLVTRFIQMCSDSNLESLVLGGFSYHIPLFFKPLLEELANSQYSSLKTLTTDGSQDVNYCHHDVVGPEDIFTVEVLLPIFRFGNLVEIELCSQFGYDLDDGAMDQMAQAWPAIQRLELREVYHVYLTAVKKPRATLRSLQSFAHHCPHLETLRVEFNAQVVPSVEDASFSNPRMQVLEVKSSPILEPEPVLIALHRWDFPKVAGAGF
ncbi:hypothetical protein FB45DRAFT_211143 [Roridomyces roridus]|uniref:Uncharacterized protein n=1 Tax=Roridomyces roridus TaxID=1738132 RepID=A0AAD7CGN2_9AGAR|nr:hypothetical protein FB45DRAFT_211143 [Roridomyces roridus]